MRGRDAARDGRAERGNPGEKMDQFRAGINLGDVIAERDDIFGDGVNVAARLEALAEPGGICVSRVVRDQIRDKLPYAFEDRGEQSVKNIVRPVRVYALRPETIAELPVAGAPVAVYRRWRSIVAPIAVTVGAVLVIAVVAWWVWPATTSLRHPLSPRPAQLLSLSSRRACLLSCCPSPISAMTPISSTSRTELPRTSPLICRGSEDFLNLARQRPHFRS